MLYTITRYLWQFSYFTLILDPLNNNECKSCKQRLRKSILSPSPSLIPSLSLRTKCFSGHSGKVAAINCPNLKKNERRVKKYNKYRNTREKTIYHNRSACRGWHNNILRSAKRICLVLFSFTSLKMCNNLCTSCKSLINRKLVRFSLDSAINSYKCSRRDRSNSPGASCQT